MFQNLPKKVQRGPKTVQKDLRGFRNVQKCPKICPIRSKQVQKVFKKVLKDFRNVQKCPKICPLRSKEVQKVFKKDKKGLENKLFNTNNIPKTEPFLDFLLLFKKWPQ